MHRSPLALLLLLSWPAAAPAVEWRAASIFGDSMVLQCDAATPVWGSAPEGTEVEVTFAGQTKRATADGHGDWRVVLGPLKASREPAELTIADRKGGQPPIRFKDVLVGEVWVCSGQSNMEWSLENSTGGPEASDRADNALLRLCTVPHNSQLQPAREVATHWEAAGPKPTRHFSAVAYWFGSKLQKRLGAPVGIINCSYGGTTIQAWMKPETLKTGPWPQDASTDVTLSKAEYDRRKAAMQPLMDKYLAEKAEAIKNKLPPPEFPRGWPGEFRGPGVLWNGMVSPLLPYRVRGVVWYQGESNAYPGVARTYGQLLPAFLADWRSGFAQPDLPVIVVQLSAFRKPQEEANERSGIAEVREAQAKTVRATPHTALVVTLDLGESDVHYKNKEPAGERVMKAALGLAYGDESEAQGPQFEKATFDGGRAVLRFSHAQGGLAAGGDGLAGFVVAGEDRNFVFADARVDGDTVVVSSPKVPHPVAVRYAWADFPKANLVNKAGLPASTFRTDDWPLGPDPAKK